MPLTFSTIIVPTDFSETSLDGWRVACALAPAVDGHVHLLHVCADPPRPPWNTEVVGVNDAAIASKWRAEAEGRLAATLPTEPTLGRITRMVVAGAPHLAILEYAEKTHADLIVMGTHGYGGVKQLLIGSVANRVLHQARCPVLMVPPFAVNEWCR